MNCSSLRSRLLALPDPTAVSDSVAAHLESCASCQAWHRVLVQVEYAVASVTVPRSDGKKKREVLAQFRTAKANKPKSKPAVSPQITSTPVIAEKAVKKSKSPVSPAIPRTPLGERLARMWPMGLVAAALLVGALAWSIKKSPETAMAKAPSDPMLKEVVAAKIDLDRAHTGADRIKVLAKLADTIHEEARTLSKVTPDEMNSLAAMYRKVVEEALIPQARSLNADERKATLPAYVQRLAEAQQLANRLAGESPAASGRALSEIAEVAEAGRIELAKLIQGRAS
ncbi:MAG: hypothetical protein EXS09_05465 [Gemmataceae bacterium]|nr:hypothetical protein [Gemmataceae bacterium]